MKTLEELAQLREQMKAKMAIRSEEGKLRKFFECFHSIILPFVIGGIVLPESP